MPVPGVALCSIVVCGVAGAAASHLWPSWATVAISAAVTIAAGGLIAWRLVPALEPQRLASSSTTSPESRLAPTVDALTGARDRVALIEWFTRAERDATAMALWRADLDHLERINDTMGHDVGDSVLIEASQRLRTAIADSPALDAVIARIGGDEFVIAAVAADHTGISRHDIDQLSERLIRTTTAPFVRRDLELTVTTSFGLCVRAAGDARLEPMLGDAGLALDRAKALGRHRLERFDDAMREQAATRASIGVEIRGAVQRDEFELYHQPLVELSTGRIVAAECLLRWNHPDRGVLTPGDFLDVADESGVLAEIGKHTIRSTCRRFATLNRAAPWPLQASLNLSAHELLIPGLPRTVRTALLAAGLPPHLLMIEISEASVTDDRVIGVLVELREIGVDIAIDDFGTAQSPLAALATLPITAVKVDRRFTGTIGRGPGGDALAGAIIDLGRAFGLDVIAEGVTTEQQADWLRSRGCGLGQGWLYGRPTSFSKLAKLVTGLPTPVDREDHISRV